MQTESEELRDLQSDRMNQKERGADSGWMQQSENQDTSFSAGKSRTLEAAANWQWGRSVRGSKRNGSISTVPRRWRCRPGAAIQNVTTSHRKSGKPPRNGLGGKS